MEKQERIRYLKYTYNVSDEDAFANFSGLSKSGVRYYSKLLGEEKPECLGGKLECEKRDLDLIHLGIDSVIQKLVPLVLCKDCKNKKHCQLGKKTKTGYYFLLSIDNKRPRIIEQKCKPIEDEVSYLILRYQK